MLLENGPLWDRQQADIQEIKVIFALAEFLKYQAANEEETVSMFDMAQNIFDTFRQQRSKQIRKFLARYMSR
jgi:hypothetical protein